MLARFLLTLGCLIATLFAEPLCAQDSGSDTAKDTAKDAEAGSTLVLGNPGGNSADATSKSDASAEKNAEKK